MSFQRTIENLQSIVTDYGEKLRSISPGEWSHRPAPAKWSKKETLGHLVDSAMSNIRRFVIAQYERNPHILYAQDDWVRLSGYQDYDVADLLALWSLLNRHICVILSHVPPGDEKRTARTDGEHTIEWLAEDYNRHLLHHLHQVLDWNPVAYP